MRQVSAQALKGTACRPVSPAPEVAFRTAKAFTIGTGRVGGRGLGRQTLCGLLELDIQFIKYTLVPA